MVNNLSRECGTCAVCCTIPEIPEVPSAAGEPCKHLCPIGCAIYTSRPQRCQDFRCLWLDGWGSISDQPNKIGWMVSIELKGILAVEESRQGALEQERFKLEEYSIETLEYGK